MSLGFSPIQAGGHGKQCACPGCTPRFGQAWPEQPPAQAPDFNPAPMMPPAAVPPRQPNLAYVNGVADAMTQDYIQNHVPSYAPYYRYQQPLPQAIANFSAQAGYDPNAVANTIRSEQNYTNQLAADAVRTVGAGLNDARYIANGGYYGQ